MKIQGKITVLLMIVVTAVPLFAQEEVEILMRIYNRAQTLDQRYAIMQSMIEQGGSTVESALIEALTELQSNKENVHGFTETFKYGRLLKMMVNALGDMKSKDGAVELMRAYRESEDPYIRGDAIIAVGKTGVEKYADEFSMDLRNYNLGAVKEADKPKLETLVLSLIKALERLKSPAGFEPVFFASIGNYAKEIRERAFQALTTMVPDPTDLLFGIIKSESELKVIYQALLAEEASDAPAAGKEKVAVEALSQALTAVTKNANERNAKAEIIIRSANMLKSVTYTSKDAITFLGKVIEDYIKHKDQKFKPDEMLAVLDTMSVNSSDENVGILTGFLKHQTDQREAGAVLKDLRIVTATIQALGATGNKIGREELTRVVYSPEWDASVIREAKAALEKLK